MSPAFTYLASPSTLCRTTFCASQATDVHAPGDVCSSNEGFSPCAKIRTMLNPADTAWPAARQFTPLKWLKARLRRAMLPDGHLRHLCLDRTWSKIEVTPFDAVRAEPAGLPPHLSAYVIPQHFARQAPPTDNALIQECHNAKNLTHAAAQCGCSACRCNAARLPTDRLPPLTPACPGQPSCAATQVHWSAGAWRAAGNGHCSAVLMHLATGWASTNPTPQLA